MTTYSPVPAAQYLRVSTDHQQYSLDDQADSISRYAVERGFIVMRTYVDAPKERPAALSNCLRPSRFLRIDPAADTYSSTPTSASAATPDSWRNAFTDSRSVGNARVFSASISSCVVDERENRDENLAFTVCQMA